MKKDIIINSDPKAEKYTEQDDEELQKKYPWIMQDMNDMDSDEEII